jgi:Arc/MetJ family transcription regulator
VVVVPHDIVDALLQRLTERAAAESSYTSAVARGEFNNAWVDALLRENGVVGIEEPAEIA